MNHSDAEPWLRGLQAAALRGDALAWRALYDSAFDSVSRYCHWRCRNPDLAEEVLQETWLTAARRLGAFDPARGTFAAWVCGIAGLSATAAIRKSCRENKRSRRLDAIPEPAMADECDHEAIALALASLPQHYEAVLRGKYLDQMSVAELAASRGETIKAVESLLTRAREAFRAASRQREEAMT